MLQECAFLYIFLYVDTINYKYESKYSSIILGKLGKDMNGM